MSDWSPDLYLRFAGERNRPALDLLAQVAVRKPETVYDLGCGPGNSTAMLLHRFPKASVTGIDNSPAMLDAARQATPGATYVSGDLATWLPDRAADVLFANAALQWVDDHVGVMLRLLASLRPGGVLAVQMPDNLDEPSHALMRMVAGNVRYVETLQPALAARQNLLPASGYINALRPHCKTIEVWRTVYHHRLTNAATIAAFFSSTGLRPFLDPLSEDEREAFRNDYEAELERAYPPLLGGGVLLAFPRLFIVASN